MSPNIIKNIKISSSIISVIVAIIGAAWAAEDRYAKNEDVAKVQQSFIQKVDELDDKMEKLFRQLEIQKYRDIIDELEDKQADGTITPAEMKKLRRAKNRLYILLNSNDNQ